MSVLTFGAIAVVVLLGSWLQGSVGFGLGMLAAPILALLAPSLVPVTVLLLAMGMSVFNVVADRHGVDLRSLGIALVGRLPGTIAGAWLVARLPEREFAFVVATSVLLGVAFAARGWQPRPTAPNVVAAGALSGVMGTATSVGGPPMALVWSSDDGRRTRGTLSAFFLIGSIMSFVGLLAFGAVQGHQVRYALYLAPAVLLGFGLARLSVRHLDRRRTRRVAMTAATIGAITLILAQL